MSLTTVPPPDPENGPGMFQCESTESSGVLELSLQNIIFSPRSVALVSICTVEPLKKDTNRDEIKFPSYRGARIRKGFSNSVF